MSPERPRREREPISIEAVACIACEVALRDGGHVPSVIAEGTTDVVVGSLPEIPDTHELRVELLHAAGQALGESAVVGALTQVYFITEGWMSMVRPDGTMQRPPSEDPDRKEVLCISGLRVEDARSTLIVFEMARDQDGALTDLRPLHAEIEGKDRVESPLLTAFADGYRIGLCRRAN